MITVGSLFTGIGGFDLGFERCGMEIVWQVENDKFCNELLEKKWPEVKRYGDIRGCLRLLPPVDLVCGGDPCPSRSVAKGNLQSRHPDLAGWFLAVVGRLRPRWVVRENVPAPDVVEFAAALELLGYGVVVIELNAKDFTSQSRRRQIVIGSSRKRTARFRQVLLDATNGSKTCMADYEKKTGVAARVTAHPRRLAAEDNYCFEPAVRCLDTSVGVKGKVTRTAEYLYDGGRLRVLTEGECEALQGFPRGWTAGFSFSRRHIMLGNAIPVPFAEFIGRLIVRVENYGLRCLSE